MSARYTTVEYTYEDDEPPTDAVVAAIAAASNREPCDMKPLFEFLDPDSLDALFRSRPSDGSTAGNIQIRFGIDEGYVTVTAEHVRVHRPEEA
jgi:hypothetical protein